jgi:hypothetical protein
VFLVGVPAGVASTFSQAPSAPLRSSAGAPAPAPPAPTPEDLERERAEAIFERYQATYRHLDGVTILVGDAPKDHQAVAYYTDGQILIDADHTVGLPDILSHEIWHIIDWRDNGRLDWGEKVPPANASDYLLD